MTLRELGAVRLRDLTQPELVYQVVHSMLRQQFPALRSLEATPNNLPQQITSFIGREHELAEVRRQLQQARLLTLVGIGGLGKSRLSLQVAADVLDEHPDGVWFVELAPVTDPTLVPQVVASVLGVKEEAGRSVEEALVRFVRDRNLLLVLDNCEHLTQACAEISRKLLEAGPHIRILASSRERLNIAGEKAYPLAPLAAPLPQQRLPLDALAHFASVRLFVDRAVAARPDFAITSGNATAVAEICHRLDGIPLALELAAARVRAMTVDKIADRLGDRFKLLARGDRTALPRQQTLRALIDWSYDLLDAAERSLFAKLSVFAGGFTLDAAEYVGEDSGHDVLEVLTSLVEKSLVTLDTEHDRYRMLETVRQYAAERLEVSGEGAATRGRHLSYYLELVEKLRVELIGPRQADVLAEFDHERENIFSAHAFCDHTQEGGDAGLRLVRAIRFYCLNRGLLAWGYRAHVDALARPTAQPRNLARCRALSDAGQFATFVGRDDEALAYLTESLEVARELGDRSRVAITLQPLGRTYLALNDLARARAHLEEALALAEQGDDQREIAAALSLLVQLCRVERNYPAAESLCERCLAIARGLDDSDSISLALLNLAMVVISRGDVGRARALLSEAHSRIAAVGSRLYGQALVDCVSGAAAAAGDYLIAARLHGAADREAAQSAIRRDRADEAFLGQSMDEVRQALGLNEFAAAKASGEAIGYEQALADVEAWLASDR